MLSREMNTTVDFGPHSLRQDFSIAFKLPNLFRNRTFAVPYGPHV